MIDHIRRLFFALLVFFVAMVLFAVWRANQQGYGLFDLLRGKSPGAPGTVAVQPKLKASDMPMLAQLDEEYTKLSAAVLPSVVSVNTTGVVQKLVQPFAGIPIFSGVINIPQSGLGSGAIISKEGHVITNFHVIQNAQDVKVTFSDNKMLEAKVIYADQNLDLALLKIESDRKDFPALSFADSEKTRVGQIVFAVGNPFGLSGTVTQGIISARNRHIGETSMDYLQTDTVINPGNSGGPLVNLRGEILGINVAIYRGDQGTNSWQGIGLAIPANVAKAAVDVAFSPKYAAAKARGPGYLGLEVNTDSVIINTGEARGEIGVLVVNLVEKSPAVVGGLLPGDVITKFDGQPMHSSSDLLQKIRSTAPGTKVLITIWRNGELGTVECVVGTPPKQGGGGM